MEDWKLQVSYKTPAGDMINVRANTADELSVLLEGVGDYSTPLWSSPSRWCLEPRGAPCNPPLQSSRQQHPLEHHRPR